MEKPKRANRKTVGGKHILRNLCTIPQFAKLVGQKRQSIFYHVHIKKSIVPTYIGMNKDLYIDYDKYKDFEFREYPRGE